MQKTGGQEERVKPAEIPDCWCLSVGVGEMGADQKFGRNGKRRNRSWEKITLWYMQIKAVKGSWYPIGKI